MAQFLEIYCEVCKCKTSDLNKDIYNVSKASLQLQHSTHFPTQAWDSIITNKGKVEKLARKWTWGEEELKYTGMEAPSKVKERLEQEGLYRPVLKLGTVLRKGEALRDMGVLKEGQKVKELFGDDGEMIVPLSGKVLMEVPLVWRARRRGSGLFTLGDDGRSGATRLLTDDDVQGIEEGLRNWLQTSLMSGTGGSSSHP